MSAFTRRPNRIVLPCGDQSPMADKVKIVPGGVIRRSPLPLVLTTYTPTDSPFSSKRAKTRRLPSGE